MAADDEKKSTLPNTSRPTFNARTESSLPPHFRQTITSVPVTPGINYDTYEPQDNDGNNSQNGGYFGRSTGDAVDPVTGGAMNPSDTAAGAKTGDDILRQKSLAPLGPQESLSDLQNAHPDLSLSGNIISATFNIPHALKYHKGADWVSSHQPFSEFSNCRTIFCAVQCRSLSWWHGGADTCEIGTWTPPWTISPLRLLQLSLLGRSAMEPHCSGLDWRD